MSRHPKRISVYVFGKQKYIACVKNKIAEYVVIEFNFIIIFFTTTTWKSPLFIPYGFVYVRITNTWISNDIFNRVFEPILLYSLKIFAFHFTNHKRQTFFIIDTQKKTRRTQKNKIWRRKKPHRPQKYLFKYKKKLMNFVRSCTYFKSLNLSHHSLLSFFFISMRSHICISVENTNV